MNEQNKIHDAIAATIQSIPHGSSGLVTASQVSEARQRLRSAANALESIVAIAEEDSDGYWQLMDAIRSLDEAEHSLLSHRWERPND